MCIIISLLCSSSGGFLVLWPADRHVPAHRSCRCYQCSSYLRRNPLSPNYAQMEVPGGTKWHLFITPQVLSAAVVAPLAAHLQTLAKGGDSWRAYLLRIQVGSCWQAQASLCTCAITVAQMYSGAICLHNRNTESSRRGTIIKFSSAARLANQSELCLRRCK